MGKTENQQQSMDNIPPAGYPTVNSGEGSIKNKKGIFRLKKKGEKGFIEGCLAALCCCFVCEECCC